MTNNTCLTEERTQLWLKHRKAFDKWMRSWTAEQKCIWCIYDQSDGIIRADWGDATLYAEVERTHAALR
jgi:hypothetical protein